MCEICHEMIEEEMQKAAEKTGTKLIAIPGVGYAFLGSKDKEPTEIELEAIDVIGDILKTAIEEFRRARRDSLITATKGEIAADWGNND